MNPGPSPGGTPQHEPEHRDTPRIPIALEAGVGTSKCGQPRTVTRDVSFDGAFLETPRGPRHQAKLHLAIKLPGENRSKYPHFHAPVVRRTAKGAALVFDRVGADACEALLGLVFARAPRDT